MCWAVVVLRTATFGAEEESSYPSAGRFGQEFTPGIIFPLTDNVEEMLEELRLIQRNGFRCINLPVRHTDVPCPGSPLRKRVEAVLAWCDQNDMGLLAELVIQYRSPGEIGDIEKGYVDAVGYVRPHVEHWLDTFEGHRSVLGVTLGNEVGPGYPNAETEQSAPRYTAGFRQWLQQKHGSLAGINRAWGTNYSQLSQIRFPTTRHEIAWVGPTGDEVFVVRSHDEPGFFDSRRYAQVQFGRFYSNIFDGLFRPALGDLAYASETLTDPYLYRVFPGASVLCWDIVVGNYPPWLLKVFLDTDPRPAFNSEFHTYHDNVTHWQWSGGKWRGPSAELTRYRYLLDALTGQWVTTLYLFRDFNKPEIASIHARTPDTLREIARLEPVIRRFNHATRASQIGVLVTEPLWHFSRSIQWHYSPPLERAYAALAATGQSWRYVLDVDLGGEAEKLHTLVVFSFDQIPTASIEMILTLPARIEVLWIGALPTQTEYRQPLPATLIDALRNRVRVYESDASAEAALIERLRHPDLPKRYRERLEVPMRWWNPDKDWIVSRMQNVRVEARHAYGPDIAPVIALINHTGDPVVIGTGVDLPWFDPGKQRAFDITDERVREVERSTSVGLGPFGIRFYRYEFENRQ